MSQFGVSTSPPVLAGDDGSRLESPSTPIAGTGRPKLYDRCNRGNPDRVVKSLARARRRPSGLERVGLASTA